METTKILVWEPSRGEPQYYDVSTDPLLRGAALQILQERMDEGYFSKPRPLENNRMYKRNKGRIFNLEMILGGSDEEEAFDEMRENLGQYRRMNKMHEENHAREQKEWDGILACLNEQDGAEAIRILTNRMHNPGERLQIIEASKHLAPAKTEEPAEV